MNAYGSTSLFGMLLATSLVSGATAMEINQQRAPATSDAPAFTLPVFLAGERLPDLQQAWRTHFSDTNEAPAGEAATLEPDAALIAAQQAMTRAEQASREAAEVRIRAEELSRRFGAGATEQAPTETAAIDTQDNTAAGAQPAVEHVLAPVDEDVAPMNASAPADDAPVIEEMATTPVIKPVKRASAPIPSRQAAQAVAPKSAPITTGLLKVNPAAPKPEADPMMPSELRAFGWNAQP